MNRPKLITGIPEEKLLPVIFSVMKEKQAYVDDKKFWKTYYQASKQYAEKKEQFMINLMKEVISLSWFQRLHMGLNQTLDYIDASFAREIGMFLGIDIETIEKEIVSRIKEPKAWAALNEDGTPKQKKVKAKKETVAE